MKRGCTNFPQTVYTNDFLLIAEGGRETLKNGRGVSK